MKKLLTYIIMILLFSLLLSGCSGGIYANLREIEHLLVIETLGVDDAAGAFELTVAAQPEKDTSLSLSARGASVTTAIARLDAASTDQELFFAHTGYLIFGEDAARSGIAPILDYVCRSPDLRMDIPLFVVRGDTANTLISEVGGEKTGISAILRTLSDDIEQRGDGKICTCAQAVNRLYRDGSFLLRALTLDNAAEEGVKTAVISGYAVIKDGALCAFIDKDDALAVTFLQNEAGVSDIDIGSASLEINGGGVKMNPVRENGRLTAVEIELNADVAVAETADAVPGQEELAQGLSTELKNRVEKVLELMKKQRADFLGLSAKLGISPEELFAAEYRVSVKADIAHSYDLSEGESVGVRS